PAVPGCAPARAAAGPVPAGPGSPGRRRWWRRHSGLPAPAGGGPVPRPWGWTARTPDRPAPGRRPRPARNGPAGAGGGGGCAWAWEFRGGGRTSVVRQNTPYSVCQPEMTCWPVDIADAHDGRGRAHAG